MWATYLPIAGSITGFSGLGHPYYDDSTLANQSAVARPISGEYCFINPVGQLAVILNPANQTHNGNGNPTWFIKPYSLNYFASFSTNTVKISSPASYNPGADVQAPGVNFVTKTFITSYGTAFTGGSAGVLRSNYDRVNYNNFLDSVDNNLNPPVLKRRDFNLGVPQHQLLATYENAVNDKDAILAWKLLYTYHILDMNPFNYATIPFAPLMYLRAHQLAAYLTDPANVNNDYAHRMRIVAYLAGFPIIPSLANTLNQMPLELFTQYVAVKPDHGFSYTLDGLADFYLHNPLYRTCINDIKQGITTFWNSLDNHPQLNLTAMINAFSYNYGAGQQHQFGNDFNNILNHVTGAANDLPTYFHINSINNRRNQALAYYQGAGNMPNARVNDFSDGPLRLIIEPHFRWQNNCNEYAALRVLQKGFLIRQLTKPVDAAAAVTVRVQRRIRYVVVDGPSTSQVRIGGIWQPANVAMTAAIDAAVLAHPTNNLQVVNNAGNEELRWEDIVFARHVSRNFAIHDIDSVFTTAMNRTVFPAGHNQLQSNINWTFTPGSPAFHAVTNTGVQRGELRIRRPILWCATYTLTQEPDSPNMYIKSQDENDISYTLYIEDTPIIALNAYLRALRAATVAAPLNGISQLLFATTQNPFHAHYWDIPIPVF
jgi:hypothetical protein